MKKLTTSDYKTSAWSGGSTTELYIFPEDSSYKKREFLWRISSAKVELQESTFTLLPNIERIILPLDGNLRLMHDSEKIIELKPFQKYSFSGDLETKSFGAVTDFNVMTREDFQAKVEVKDMVKGEVYVQQITAKSKYVIYCYEGKGTIGIESFAEKDIYIFDSDNEISIKTISETKLIIVEITEV